MTTGGSFNFSTVGGKGKEEDLACDARCDRKLDELVGRGKFLLRDTLTRILFCVQQSREMESREMIGIYFFFLFLFWEEFKLI